MTTTIRYSRPLLPSTLLHSDGKQMAYKYTCWTNFSAFPSCRRYTWPCGAYIRTHNNLAVTAARALYAWGELGLGDETTEVKTPAVVVRRQGGAWRVVAAACEGQQSIRLFRKRTLDWVARMHNLLTFCFSYLSTCSSLVFRLSWCNVSILMEKHTNLCKHLPLRIPRTLLHLDIYHCQCLCALSVSPSYNRCRGPTCAHSPCYTKDMDTAEKKNHEYVSERLSVQTSDKTYITALSAGKSHRWTIYCSVVTGSYFLSAADPKQFGKQSILVCWFGLQMNAINCLSGVISPL